METVDRPQTTHHSYVSVLFSLSSVLKFSNKTKTNIKINKTKQHNTHRVTSFDANADQNEGSPRSCLISTSHHCFGSGEMNHGVQ
ncbi:hypothetical protein P8452_46616 [Trifolium repens]|nr:hypothetical protein P8452_46616 [Trifolium repens]